MLKNYLIIAWRNLLKNKVFSLINIMGLAIGMSIFIITMQYVFFERSYDTQYKYSDRLFRVTVDGFEEGQLNWQDAETYYSSGPALKEKYPEIDDYARICFHPFQKVEVENRKFEPGNIYLAETGFLELFNVRILYGNANKVLQDPNTVIVSVSTARKYFGKENAIGRTLKLDSHLMTVTGIFKDSPVNSHIHYDMLVSFKTGEELRPDLFKPNFNNNSLITYLLLSPADDYDPVIKKIYSDTTVIPWNNEHHLLQPVKDIHLYSHKTYEAEANGNSRIVNFLFIIGFISIIIAWLNYINLTTAKSVERAREVGIRKVAGSEKHQLIMQFMVESLIMNLMAVFTAITILQLSTPLLRVFLQNKLVFTFPSLIEILPLTSVILLSGMIISCIYPAFIMTSFNPVSVLKGINKINQGKLLRKVLTTIQFSAGTVLITATLVIYNQNHFMLTEDTGFNMKHILVVKFPGFTEDEQQETAITSFLMEINKLPFISDYCITNTLPGTGEFDLNSNTGIYRIGDENREHTTIYYQTFIDEHFLNMLQIKLLAGRNFSASLSTDVSCVIINNLACTLLGFKSPEDAIGNKIFWGGDNREIIGVVKDFFYYSLKSPVYPMILNYDKKYNEARYFAFRLEGNDNTTQATLKMIRKNYNQFFPDDIFSSFQLEDSYNRQYNNELLFQQISLLFSVFAIIVACMGLFGMSLLEINSHIKEAGIRKSMGATGFSIASIFLISNLKLICLSLIISLPLAYLIMNKWLQSFPIKIEIGWWFYIIPVVLILFVALATISYNIMRIVKSDPVKSLKYE